jgi:hypothetical protein
MARGKLRFSEREATRLIRAAVKAGVRVQRVEVDRDNKIVVILGPQEQRAGANERDDIAQKRDDIAQNEWDVPNAGEVQQ